ncbi:MAG: UvrD-helicase domain-containing protein [Clostridiales bacterium]|nr:UvrD-helicase domain-containing protein [Clostridiales bacterium]
MDLKKLLNPEQYDAATTIDGPVLILAGAGSGKTRVLTYRIAHMIEDLGIYPSQILAITFTNKAAGEMKDRVRRMVGDIVDNMWISTFHSCCVRILRREIDKLGYKKDFTIYDSTDQKTLIKQCMKELNINEKDITDSEIIGRIGKAKDNLISAEQFKKDNQYNFRDNKIADVYVLYQKRLKSNNALDFDDLIFKTVELFRTNSEVLEFYQRKFKYIMVDEYQDTNKSQYELVRLLSKAHKNICVVGDDDQCFPRGTLVSTDNGNVEIQDISAGQHVLCAAGNGEVTKGTVEKVIKKEYNGIMVRVKTEKGKEIVATPNHITFAALNIIPDVHYVYLMYKAGVGYRIGQTKAVRSRYENQFDNGLAVRLNQEKADKMWIVKECESKAEASYYEQFYSVKYGIPTAVFHDKGRSITMSQQLIDKLFKEIDSYAGAEKLMDDLYLYEQYPHHFSSAVTRGETSRKIINISYFSCKKSESRGYYSHRISFITSGEEEREKFVKAGFPVRTEGGNSWRIETERSNYDEAEALGRKICSTMDGLSIMRKAKLTNDKSFYFMPFGSLRKGMSIVINNNGHLEEDIVQEVTCENYKGFVYDLSIPELRQYIAQDVVVHNCIYEWRGADIRNILDFEKDYPNAKVVKLEQNYRSKGNILNAANSVIKNNSERKHKVLRTESDAGEKIKIYRAPSDREEAQFVASEIEKLIEKEDRSYKDFAILYRTNAQSRIFEDTFIKRNIPYRLIGGHKFYDRKEIKDIMAYLKVLNNPDDDISLQRIINVPKRNIGAATVDKLIQHANDIEDSLYNVMLDVDVIPTLTARNKTAINKFMELMEGLQDLKEQLTVSELVNAILEDTGYIKELENSKEIEDESRIENLKELVSAAVDFENTSEDKSLAAFLEKTALVADVDNYDEEADSVVMMTVHSAKGLEFPVVFMVGMENGIFPGSSSFQNPHEMEESRRLCYVGITRAKEKLYMTSAELRMVFGRTSAFAPSDFLNEISSDLVEYLNKTPIASRQVFQRGDYGDSYNTHSLRNTTTSFEDAAKELNKKLNYFMKAEPAKSKAALTEAEAVAGTKVRHAKFGVGTIVSAKKEKDDVKLTIAFDNMGIKMFLLSMTPLELV